VLHIATVHFYSDRWLEPQLAYLARNLNRPYCVWATLEGIDARPYADRVREVVPAGLRHAENLNGLAGAIAREADPEDLLVFLDGDAFPVAPLDSFLDDTLGRYPLAAVRRDENHGDRQPHPCFAATTVGFWTEIGGDWHRGYRWRNASGSSTSDVGGNLLGILERRGIEWRPLLRTNRRDLRPPWFAVYEDLVYHHGAGFRPPISRAETFAAGPRFAALLALTRRLPPGVHRTGHRAFGRLVERWMSTTRAETELLSDEIFARLRTDPSFWLDV
jgi:hypothetical protein